MTDTAGLLKRAAQVRSQNEPLYLDADFEEGDAGEGITAEDRREILKTIEKVATGNRIAASPQALAPRPLHKGYIFPLVVNLLAAALTAALVFGLSVLFRQRDRGIEAGGAALTSAEGKLIEEVRRESDTQLQEKDRAIADIQTKMTALDKERNDLATNLDARVNQKAAQLKLQMQDELDKERVRLTALGASAATIQDQLNKLEAQKTADLDKQLSDFKRQADAERSQAEANYRTMRDEYQANIASLGADRQKILDAAKQREDELRSSLDAKTRTLETQNAAAQAGLAQAQAQLALLTEQRDSQQAVEDRILGLYDTIRQALRDRRFTDAASGASALVGFLNDPSVAGLSAEQGRRTADLFIADALGTLAKEELDRSSADTTTLLAQADLLSQAKAAANEADRALKAGDLATADAKYQEALAKVPEILAAHQYFLGKLQDAESAKKSRMDTALGLAGEAFKARDFTAATQRYSEALAYLPVDDATRQGIMQRIASIGADSTDQSRRASDTRAARESMATARRDLASGRWAEAIGGFVSVLSAYPLADQSAEALAGIGSARDGMLKDAAAQAQADAARIAALQATSDKALGDIQAQNQRLGTNATQIAADRDAAKAALADAQRQIADLTAKLQATTLQTASAASQAGAATPAATQAASSGDYQALLAEKNRLAEAAGRYDGLLASYADFAKQVQASQGAAGLNARLASLYGFLDRPEARSAFPILKDFIQRSLQDYQSSRPSDDVNNAASIAAKALGYADPAARASFLNEQSAHYTAAGNSFVVDFIATLSGALK